MSKHQLLVVVRRLIADRSEAQRRAAVQEARRAKNRREAWAVILSCVFAIFWTLAWTTAILVLPALRFGILYLRDNRADPTLAEFLHRGPEALVEAQLVEAQLALEVAEEEQ